jgi:hypothetical protein
VLAVGPSSVATTDMAHGITGEVLPVTSPISHLAAGLRLLPLLLLKLPVAAATALLLLQLCRRCCRCLLLLLQWAPSGSYHDPQQRT